MIKISSIQIASAVSVNEDSQTSIEITKNGNRFMGCKIWHASRDEESIKISSEITAAVNRVINKHNKQNNV